MDPLGNLDPVATGKFLFMLGAVAGIYLKIKSSLRAMVGKGEGREITNNPLNTQSISRAATMEDVVRVDLRVSQLEHRMEAHQMAAQKWRDEHSTDINDLRDRIEDKLEVIADALQQLNRAVGRLEH